MFDIGAVKVAVLGLGYVGLPLAVSFARHFDVIGFDVNAERVGELNNNIDNTLEVDSALLAEVKPQFTSDIEALRTCNVFIICVPTPIDDVKRPNLAPLLSASALVAKVLKTGDTVIYESTVYPGATEEDCVPVLDQFSGLKFNQDFFVGYSPERINPGDKEHRFETIVKVTSGSTPEAAEFVDQIYKKVVTAGTHKTSSIRVAEAAKVIENTQRDLNIALVNELAILFRRLDLDTLEVLEAAGTKWNFLNFRPGLVGGHCISVDPYYLTHKAQECGHHVEVILSGRRVNDGMGHFVASQLVKMLTGKGHPVSGAKVLIMGLTFKENCPDLRNTRVVDIKNELEDYGIDVDIYDSWVSSEEARREYNVQLVETPEEGNYNAIIIAVGHHEYQEAGASKLQSYLKPAGVIYDLKGILPKSAVDARL